MMTFVQATELLNIEQGSDSIGANTLKNRWFGGNNTVIGKLPPALAAQVKVNGHLTDIGLEVARSYLPVSRGLQSVEEWLECLENSYPDAFQTASPQLQDSQPPVMDGEIITLTTNLSQSAAIALSVIKPVPLTHLNGNQAEAIDIILEQHKKIQLLEAQNDAEMAALRTRGADSEVMQAKIDELRKTAVRQATRARIAEEKRIAKEVEDEVMKEDLAALQAKLPG